MRAALDGSINSIAPDHWIDRAISCVTVFGGTGFLGRRVVHQLRDSGATARIASRHPGQADGAIGLSVRISSLECKKKRDTHVSPCAGTMHNIGGNAAARRRYRSQRCNEQQGGNEHGDTSRALLLRSCRNRSERSAGGDGILPLQCVPVLVGRSRECVQLVEARKRQGHHGRRSGRPLHENEHERGNTARNAAVIS